jgi:phosphatidylcholine synthase
LLPLLASAFGFSRAAAKTDDGYFLGFPSYWNIVSFYFYFLEPPPWFGIATIVILALLTFVPSRYLYTTQPGRLSRIANVLAAPWAMLLIGILVVDTPHRRSLALVSLYFPVFYMTTSWWVTWRGPRGVK